MTSPTLTFGRYRGQTVDALPDDYVRWLADPARAQPQPGTAYRPLPEHVVTAARARAAIIDEQKMREKFAHQCLGGHPTGQDAPIYVIECDGDCHSRSGAYTINGHWFASLDAALAFLSSEFPEEDRDGTVSRTTPDPEDDMIIVWEVLPAGHRKSVWAFFGWHHSHSSEHHACGQGALPGDADSLYSLAMRDC